MVAIPPAIDGSLDEPTLASQLGVQFSQRPANGIAFGLVDQPVSPVLVFAAACSWVDAVLGLEFLAQVVHVDGLDVAADRVFHLDSISGVLEGDPLYSVTILPHDERCGRGDGAWCCA